MSRVQFLFVMVVLAVETSAHIGGLPNLQDLNPRVYCGRALARMIATICYDDPVMEKRSDTGTMYGAIIPSYYKEQDTRVGWPWMSPSKAHALGTNRSNKRFISGGVADECCDKPCSISELLYYC